jgi:hypothetical protein
MKAGQTVYRVELVKSESVLKYQRGLTGAEIREQFKDGIEIDGARYTVKKITPSNFKVSRRNIPAEKWNIPEEVKLSAVVIAEIEADYSAMEGEAGEAGDDAEQ